MAFSPFPGFLLVDNEHTARDFPRVVYWKFSPDLGPLITVRPHRGHPFLSEPSLLWKPYVGDR